MLHLIVGAPGVGKTTIIQCLQRKFGWKPIPTYTTRPPRRGDMDRVFVSPAEFTELLSTGKLFTHKELYGNCYGEDRASVIQATSNNKECWCLDLALSQIEKFQLPYVRKIIVLTPTLDQLAEQLARSGRSERIPDALLEFQQCEEYSRTARTSDDTLIVRNNLNQFEGVAEQIFSWRR